MAWAGILVRRSASLQHGDPSTTKAPPSPKNSNNSGSPAKPTHLLDLELGVEFFPLHEMDVEFNANSLNFQEYEDDSYSSWKEAFHDDE